MSENWPDELEPGMVLPMHAEGELPATSWTLRIGDEVIAAGEFDKEGTAP